MTLLHKVEEIAVEKDSTLAILFSNNYKLSDV